MARLGRPREFDLDEALDDAMHAFWANGYEATSLADLMEATGLQKGSIYKAFGDKRSLFLRALDRYLSMNLAGLEKAVAEHDDPAEAVEAALVGMVRVLCDPRNDRRGCFATNSVMELAGRDREVADRLALHFERQRSLLEASVGRAQRAGAFRDDEPAGDVALTLVLLVPGLVAGGKLGARPEQGERLARLALRLLRPTAA